MAKTKNSPLLIFVGIVLILASVLMSSNGFNFISTGNITSSQGGTTEIKQDVQQTTVINGSAPKKEESENNQLLLWMPALLGVGTLALEVAKYLRPQRKPDDK